MEYLNLHRRKMLDACSDAIESLQIAIVRAGGLFIDRQKIESMTVAELLNMMTKNYIAVRYMKDDESTRRKDDEFMRRKDDVSQKL